MGEYVEWLRANNQLTIDIKSRPVEDIIRPAYAIQFGDGDMAGSTFKTFLERCLVYTDADCSVDKVVATSLPQITLIGKELIVNLPECIHILPADTISGGMSVKTGIAMI